MGSFAKTSLTSCPVHYLSNSLYIAFSIYSMSCPVAMSHVRYTCKYRTNCLTVLIVLHFDLLGCAAYIKGFEIWKNSYMKGVPKISSADRLHEWIMGQNLGKIGKIHLYLWVPGKNFHLHDCVGHLMKVTDLHLWGIGQKAHRSPCIWSTMTCIWSTMTMPTLSLYLKHHDLFYRWPWLSKHMFRSSSSCTSSTTC